MANIETTDIDRGEVALGDNQFEDGLFNGADVLAKGTIMARDSDSLKFRLFVKGGATNENGIPRAVLTHALTTVAGDNAIRVLVSGAVKKERLVIDADGDDSNIDGSVRDDLRATGIIPVDTEQLALDDNPQQVDS